MKISKKVILKFLTIVFLAGLAIYFRTYFLHGGPDYMFRSADNLARTSIDNAMTAQVLTQLKNEQPNAATDVLKKVADTKVKELKAKESEKYKQVVEDASKRLQKLKDGSNYRYLLEADGYYFLRLTERILKTGKIADEVKGGQYLDELKRGPKGSWTQISLHSYVGFAWVKLVRFFIPNADIMKTLGTLSIFLSLLIIPVYFSFNKVLKLPFAGAIIGSAVIILSPVFIQRSALGWYDTDAYNYLFPLAILGFLFYGINEKNKFWLGVLGSTIFTAIYSVFWPGWQFIAVLVPFCLFFCALILWFWRSDGNREFTKKILVFLALYTAGTFIFLACVLTPSGIVDLAKQSWSTLNKFALSDFDVWPNIFLTVSEAASISFIKLIFLTGNVATFFLAVMGLVRESRAAVKEKDVWLRFRLLFFVFFSLPILVMSLVTERFSLLFVLPLAVFVSFYIKRFLESFQKFWLNKAPFKFSSEKTGRAIGLVLFAVIFTPLLFISAHVVSQKMTPIMNDTWFAAMKKIEADTPKDAIVDSWWPPGYFVSALANRRVVVDGGSQHFRTSYWLAKAFVSEDEREAAGIIRMLHISMEDAPELLESWGMRPSEFVPLILKIVRLNRGEAFKSLPNSFTEKQKNQILDKTHGSGEFPPSYEMLYDDMITQNLSMTTVAQWDFAKAEMLRNERRSKREIPESKKMFMGGAKNYVQDMRKITGEWMKYSAVSPMTKRNGNILFFENGIQVNLDTKQAVYLRAETKTVEPLKSFFEMKNGQLEETLSPSAKLDVSVLVAKWNNQFFCAVADSRLIRSMMYRLYFLNGEGLKIFKPFWTEGSILSGTCIRIFELDREKLAELEK